MALTVDDNFGSSRLHADCSARCRRVDWSLQLSEDDDVDSDDIEERHRHCGSAWGSSLDYPRTFTANSTNGAAFAVVVAKEVSCLF